MSVKFRGQFKGIVAKKAYDEGTSLSLAVATDLAYSKNSAEIKRVANGWGFSQVEVFKVKKGKDIDTQCFVMADDDNLVVVFRGSDSIADWLANFQASHDPGPLKKTNAHEGFQDALFPAVISVTDILNEFNARQKKIWITGHSLGGALCSLYAGMLVENGFSIYGIYTFASPRAGSGGFADQLNAAVTGPHYRVVNHEDVVPHVPPEPFYSHSGSRVILKLNRKERTKTSWFKQRINVVKQFIDMVGQTFDVADNHRLSSSKESYIPRLIADFKRTN